MLNRTQTADDEPFATRKAFIFPAEKSDVFSRCMGKALGIFILASCIFVLYSGFSTQSRWRYPGCTRNINHSGNRFLKLTPIPGESVKTNISHILFGIGGSAQTWNERRHYSDLWWDNNTMRGFVWLDQKLPENESWPDNSPPYQVSEDTSRFKYTCTYGSRSALRIARIVSESYRLGLENVRWFVMGDDDTVFFTENLVKVLSKYDHKQFYYIGGISESVEQDVIHSYGMAYGGGGFAISYPLAAQLARILDSCLDRYTNFYGSDQRIGACLNEIGVPLTRELGFHQVDIRGDPYGLLAAHPVAPLVSLHHLNYVKPLIPSGTQLDALRTLVGASKVDQGRTLQQSFCYDMVRNWSVSVSWGYTIQIYPWVLSAKDLSTPLLTFQTWRTYRGEPFTFNTRPLQPDPCERPVVYFLDRGYELDRNKTVTLYKKYAEKECNKAEYLPALKAETVRVVSPKMEVNEWMQAPRRHCCDVHGITDERSLQVRIRRCNTGESVTPP